MALIKSIMRHSIPRATVCWLTARYIKFVKLVGRWSVEQSDIPNKLIAENKSFLVAFWHGRLLMMSEAWPYDVPFNMVVSQHPDGQLIARTIAQLGFKSISGSTTAGGGTVVRATIKALKNGQCVGITPDGPKGPRMHVAPGIVQTARLAGVPILPIAYTARPSRIIKSWDRLLIPLPFSRGIIRWGKPIVIERDADPETILRTAELLESRLNELVSELDACLGLMQVEPAASEANA